jgi:hypothetical protein
MHMDMQMQMRCRRPDHRRDIGPVLRAERVREDGGATRNAAQRDANPTPQKKKPDGKTGRDDRRGTPSE